MNIGLIGARRTSNGIGEYIGKYFHACGAKVLAVLGTTPDTSALAASNLEKYGIHASPYTDLSHMIDAEEIDAVAIASPVQTHLPYIRKCIEAGVHIFCEKPFISPEIRDSKLVLDEIFTRAEKAGITIAMNSQWCFSLPYYEGLCGREATGRSTMFTMRLSPVCSGADMIPDSVPHALSMLYTMFGQGSLRGLNIEAGKETMEISFTYAGKGIRCLAEILLVTEKVQPRTFSFGFGGRIVERTIDMETYRIGFVFKGRTIGIPDPLELSVRDFICCVEQKRSPTVGREHIVATSLKLGEIYDAYMVH
ncbi:MAG TPA: Gfo/Idh/MocA family oxidoreductase [Deltaproteobacteria bacterium]|nr:Gfo/Idh/MocA family oxidoreductase [Deltaproteobacteria bacterium]